MLLFCLARVKAMPLLSPPEGLIPISVATLSPDALAGVDIYLRASPQSPPILFCAAAEHPSLERLKTIEGESIHKLYIDHADRRSYQAYLRAHWEELLDDNCSDRPFEQQFHRMSLISEVMRDVLNEEFLQQDTDGIVLASKDLGQGMCRIIGQETVVVRQLCDVLHHDYATFTHTTNVSLFCVLLARELGFSGKDLEDIAIGGILHDIGKLQIDERILTKPGKLDEFEFREVKKHPLTGFIELVDRPDVGFGQLMMVYQHHERLDGSGYPVGCVGNEIHPWARLCAIVDVYEALTSQRPYRKPMQWQTALAVLERGCGTEFDKEMLRCWQQMIKQKH